MGNQSAAVRQLNVGGIFTTAATATVIFLAGDWANGKPLTSRRLASIYAPVFPLVVTAVVVATAARVFRDRVKPGKSHWLLSGGLRR